MTAIDIPPAPGSSNYPPELIVRDVIGAALAKQLRGLRDQTHDTAALRTLLSRRAAAVNRHDIAADQATLGGMTAAVRELLPNLVGDLIAHAEHGPTPTPDAYAAACAALEKHRARADAAEVEVAQLRVELATLRAGQVAA
jgi:hypothetical protein